MKYKVGDILSIDRGRVRWKVLESKHEGHYLLKDLFSGPNGGIHEFSRIDVEGPFDYRVSFTIQVENK